MMYYLEKIRLNFADHDPDVEQLLKLMSRCVKLYNMIDSFINIFKLISKKEVSFIIFQTLTIFLIETPIKRRSQNETLIREIGKFIGTIKA